MRYGKKDWDALGIKINESTNPKLQRLVTIANAVSRSFNHGYRRTCILTSYALDDVLRRHRALDEQFESAGGNAALAALPERDRALTRALVATVLRRLGTLRHLLDTLLAEGLPQQAPRVETALLIGAAQILFLDVPDHAAVDLAVRLVRADRQASYFSGLVNAVLRRMAREGKEWLTQLDAAVLDTPPWLFERWVANYGETTARAIAAAKGRWWLVTPSDRTIPSRFAARQYSSAPLGPISA